MDQSKVQLTEEQKRRIEHNHKIALEKLRQKRLQNATSGANSKNAFDFIIKAGKTQKNPPNQPLLKSNQTSTSTKPTNVLLKINLFLNGVDEFGMQFSFDEQLVQLCKSTPEKRYDPAKKMWFFPLKEYVNVVQKLKKLPTAYYQLIEIPKNVLELQLSIHSNVHNPNEIPLSKIDPKVLERLMPFQMESVKFALSNNGRILLADDMGLGKTVQALAIASYYRNEWPLLIVSPSSLRQTWKEAICDWLSTNLAPCDVNVIYSAKDFHSSHPVTVVSYELLAKFIATNSGIKFNIVIGDESHYLKNRNAHRTKTFMSVASGCRRIILLSGTPALSKPIELYAQIKTIAPSFFPNFHMFGVRYCNATKTNFGWTYDGCSNVDELKFILQSKFMIRRLKCDVTQDLPPKTRKIIYLDPTLVDYSKLSECSSSIKKQKSKASLRSKMLEYFGLTAKAKASAVCDYIQDRMETEQKFIVFAHHQYMLDTIEKFLVNKKCEFIRIDGSTKSQLKQQYIDQFQNDPRILVALLSITSVCTGLTITNASSVIFAELFWNPGILAQAEDRIYRIGQKSAVTAVYLIAKSTCDDYMWPLIRSKLQILQGVGVSSHDISSGLSIDIMDSTKISLDNLFADIEVGLPDEK